MNNVQGNVNPYRKYDLKGATYNRRAKPKRESKITSISPTNSCTEENIIFKDEDFLEKERTLKLDEQNRELLIKRITNATDLLSHANIIDYSMLIQKIKCPIDKIDIPKVYLYNSTVENEVYCISIIDMLQQYGFKRLLEKGFKGLVAERASQVGAQDPEFYASRMVKFLETILPKEPKE